MTAPLRAAGLLALLAALPARGADAPDCKDPALLKRLPGYEIQSCDVADADVAAFALAPSANCDEYKKEDVEGKWTYLTYAVKDGADAAAAEKVQKHVLDAVKAAGGTVVLTGGTIDAGKAACMDGNLYDRLTTAKVVKGTAETWIMVAPGSDSYQVYVVERGAKK
jgi:hypothetical protein